MPHFVSIFRIVLGHSEYIYLYHLITIEIQQLALSLLKTKTVTVHQVMSFGARPIFCHVDMPDYDNCILSSKATC